MSPRRPPGATFAGPAARDFRRAFHARKRRVWLLYAAFLASMPLVVRWPLACAASFGAFTLGAMALNRCPACGSVLPRLGMDGVWWGGERLVHSCGALLQDEVLPAPVARHTGWRTWVGLATYVSVILSGIAAAAAVESWESPPPAIRGPLLPIGAAVLFVAAALHARWRGRSPLWGFLAVLGPLAIPVLALMGSPCPRCRRPVPWRWSPCRACLLEGGNHRDPGTDAALPGGAG